MAVQTYTGLTAEQMTFYNRSLLDRLLPSLVFYNYGQKKPIPKNNGDKVNFRRFDSLDPATELTEGVVPSGNSISITAVEAQLKQYGDFITVSDKLDMAGIDPVITEATDVLGEQGALTIDGVIRDIVCAGTNVQYSGSATQTSNVSAVLTPADVFKAVRALRSANAKPLRDGYYIGIIHPKQAYDLMQYEDANGKNLWQDVSKYNGGTSIMKGEVGKLGGVRFIESTNVKVKEDSGSGSADVYCGMILGKDAYGVSEIEGSGKPKIIVKPHGSAGSADPLDQIASIGWKAMVATARLNELAMIRLESTVSA